MKKRYLILWLSFGLVVVTGLSFYFVSRPKQTSEKKQIYTCAMHPDVKSDHPGDCPICHMKLIPATPVSAERKVLFYRNPMNPSITSKVPTKDNMGMDYIAVYEDESVKVKENIAGRSSFEINSLQANNLRIRTVKIETKELIDELKASARVLNGSRIAIQVTEADALEVKVGQVFSFKSLSSPKELSGKIVFVDNALDPMSRTVRVVGNLQRNAGLRAESSGTAVIEVKMGQGIFVPSDAVIRTGEADLIYVVSSNQITPRKVQLGAKVAGGFQVLSGVEAGEEISAASNFLLDAEARIRAVHD